ncbi:MAG: M23 family metallopeptidase [Alphaproteobacteria bacterium]|nr:M23 family metallopeptidase [Alphaproteobacteria bacterium]
MNSPIAYAHLMLLTLLVLLGSGCSRGLDESPVSFEERSTRHTENMTPAEWESFKNKAIESIIRKYTGEGKSGSGKIHVAEIPQSSALIESAPLIQSEPSIKPKESLSLQKLDIPETLAPSALPATKSPSVKSEQKTQEKVERYSQLKIKPEETKGKQYKVPPNAVIHSESIAIAPSQPMYAWPVKGSVSKGYGASDKGTNNGINIKAKAGSPVIAIDNGKVIFVGAIKGMGKVILIEHPNQIIAAYAQVGSIAVRANDTVKKSQRIADILAAEGSDGELHFELRKGTKSLNPMDYLTK